MTGTAGLRSSSRHRKVEESGLPPQPVRAGLELPQLGPLNLAQVFRPHSIVLVGGDLPEAARMASNLASFPSPVLQANDPSAISAMPSLADLAVLTAAATDVPAALAALGRRGIRLALVTTPMPGGHAALREAGLAAGVRAMGPGSFGLCAPSLGLNASLAHTQPRQGRVALVSQSAARCRAVVDWTETNGMGFSYIVGVGDNAGLGLGFAAALDWLSHDAGTGVILLDISRLHDQRAFISAARAASCLRPVVAFRPGGRLLDADGTAEEVFEAALRRAGVVSVRSYEDFLAAAETLARAPPARRDTLAIVTNSISLGRVAADAALAAGLQLHGLSEGTAAALDASPQTRIKHRVVQVDADALSRLAKAAATLATEPNLGGILAIMAPTGGAEEPCAAALAACSATNRLPLLACVVGESTGAGLRAALATAELPVFASPDQAVRGFGHLVHRQHVSADALELPPSKLTLLHPGHAADAAAVIAEVRVEGRTQLRPHEALRLLAAYGAAVPAFDGRPVGSSAVKLPAVAVARQFAVHVHDDPMFGPTIAFGSGDLEGSRVRDAAHELLPLNLVLAQAMIERSMSLQPLTAWTGLPDVDRDAVADALVRLSQLLVDLPEIATLDIGSMLATACGVTVLSARISLRAGAGAPASRLAIAPYPGHLARPWVSRTGQGVTLRPVRPEDAEAHDALFHRLTPEDIRFRFFSPLKHLSAEQTVRLTRVDYVREMTFVAMDDDDETMLGVGQIVRPGPGMIDAAAEFGILVETALKGQGLATELMHCLLDWAEEQGVPRVVGTILSENAPMLGFARHLGFDLRCMPDEPGVTEAVLNLTGKS